MQSDLLKLVPLSDVPNNLAEVRTLRGLLTGAVARPWGDSWSRCAGRRTRHVHMGTDRTYTQTASSASQPHR